MKFRYNDGERASGCDPLTLLRSGYRSSSILNRVRLRLTSSTIRTSTIRRLIRTSLLPYSWDLQGRDLPPGFCICREEIPTNTNPQPAIPQSRTLIVSTHG